MAAIKYIASAFTGFLTLFLSEGPRIHVLYSALSDLLKNILNRFTKPAVVQNKESGDLLTITMLLLSVLG